MNSTTKFAYNVSTTCDLKTILKLSLYKIYIYIYIKTIVVNSYVKDMATQIVLMTLLTTRGRDLSPPNTVLSHAVAELQFIAI